MKKRVVFFGTPKIACSCMQALLERNDIEIVGVVTQPDRPFGRKKILMASDVKKLAMINDIKVFQPEKIGDIYEELKMLHADLFFTCAYGQFIPECILNIPRYKSVNLHTSLLPKYRGGAPIHWSIIKGEVVTGISLIYMNKKMDSGKIILKESIDLHREETYNSLYEKLSLLAYDTILNKISVVFDENVKCKEQDENDVSFAPNISRADERINWSDSATNIYNKIRGMNSIPGAYAMLNNKTVKIYDVSLSEKTYEGKEVGCIVEINKESISVALNYATLLIKSVKIEGGVFVRIKDIINGKHIFEVGERFN